MSNSSPAHSPGRKRLVGSLSRGGRLALVGGLAAGVAFAGATGLASATGNGSSSTTGSSPSVSSPTNGRSTPPAHPRPGRRGPGGPGRGPLGGLGGPGGPGGGGTITAINGSTLTLRTMNGTETVDTSSSTTYTKEMTVISFSKLAVGDVVQVAGTPASSSSSTSSSATTPPQPGTGTVDATRVTVVEPSFTGRVSSDSSGTLDLVGPDGQLLTVSTTSATRYDNGTAQTSASSISDGSHVVVEGPQTSLTHIDADVVFLAPQPPTPRRAPAVPAGRSASSPSSGTSPSTSSPSSAGGS